MRLSLFSALKTQRAARGRLFESLFLFGSLRNYRIDLDGVCMFIDRDKREVCGVRGFPFACDWFSV